VAIPQHVQTFSSQEPPSVTDVGASGSGPDPVGALTEILGATNHGGPAIQPPPQPVQRPKRPLLVSVGVMEARLIQRVEPTYPESARLLHMSGVVQLRAIIGTDGRVRELTALSGNPILANAAQAAVRQWRYLPTFLDNQPVEVETFITVTFVLGEQ
jgi:TonB family protein